MATTVVSSTHPSPFILERALPKAEGGALDLVLEFFDRDGNPIDSRSYAPSREHLQEDIVPLTIALYRDFAATQPETAMDPTEFFTSTSLYKNRDICQIQRNGSAISGANIALSGDIITGIRNRYGIHGWNGSTVADGMGLMIDILNGRKASVLSGSAQGDRTSSSGSPAGSASAHHLPPHATGARTSFRPTSAGNTDTPPTATHVRPIASRREPEGPLFFEGNPESIPASACSDPQARRVLEATRTFSGERFQLLGKEMGIKDILYPTAEDRPLIKALLDSSIRKIRNDEDLTEDETMLWGMIQGYYFHYLNSITNPWSSQLRRTQEEWSSYASHWPCSNPKEAAYKVQLTAGFTEVSFKRFLQKYDVDTTLISWNPTTPDKVSRKLWIGDIWSRISSR